MYAKHSFMKCFAIALLAYSVALCIFRSQPKTFLSLSSDDIVDCRGAGIAPDDSVGLWFDDPSFQYWIMHDTSEPGKKTLSARKGDTLSLDGHAWIVSNVVEVNRNSTLQDALDALGPHALYMQVCVPDAYRVISLDEK